MDVPDKILKDIVCSQCSEILSVFPVYTYKDGQFVCGRCPVVEEDEPFRDTAYEALAKDLCFPCIYKSNGCIEKQTPEELVSHEPSCHYKTWYCPQLPECKWQGIATELHQHYNSDHSDNMIEEVHSISISSKTFEINYVMDAINQLFLIQLKKNDHHLLIDVRLIGLKKFAGLYNFNFSLNSPAIPDGIQFPKHIVNWENSNPHVIPAMAQTISEEHMKMLGSKAVKLQIFVTKDKKQLPKQPEKISALNETILKRLECPICFEHMVAPIYQCTNGHMLCDTCKKKVTICPSCKIALGATRNRILEDITNDILYRCSYEGCEHTYKAKEKQLHCAECEFAPYACPLKDCAFTSDFQAMATHIEQEHSEQALQYNEVNVYFTDGREQVYILKKNDSLLKLSQKIQDGEFFLSVAHYGPRNVSNDYYYIADMRNGESNAAERIVAKFKCTEPNIAPYTDGFLQLPVSLLEPFKNDAHMTYKIMIVSE